MSLDGRSSGATVPGFEMVLSGKMSKRRGLLWAAFLCCAVGSAGGTPQGRGQEAEQAPQQASAPKPASTQKLDSSPQETGPQDGEGAARNVPAVSQTVKPEYIEQQIRDLSHPSYRARQLARWRLEQHPKHTIEAIQDCLPQVEYNTGAQLIDLLSVLATHGDLATSLQSRTTLSEHANRVSSIGRLADNAVQAIADLQEEQAYEILIHHGARIGLPGVLNFNLNARMSLPGSMKQDELALWIDERFSGDEQAIEWIQFLKSIKTVFLEGPNIDSRYFQAVTRLPQVRNVKLKYVTLTKDDLELLKSFTALELLELNYTNVDDDILDTLAELPISQSLRLYGTQITQAGAERLAQQLDGIEIYCGGGGYLGVSTDQSNTIVSRVIAGSGAQQAGILIGDELQQVNGVTIKVFDDLRTELGKYVAGEKIKIVLSRRVSPLNPGTVELELEVKLGEDPR
ncbi:MAG: PDZ domain-containing protein [Planctomycetales bacterium]|nr:PDZ domain-containing protein [Planctomycetales bacterium]